MTAEAFVSTALQFYPHSYKKPHKKCTVQEIEGHIHELVDDNSEGTKNVDLELKFQKYQSKKINWKLFA